MGSNDLPDHASVVVIGGGVMGCSTLYHLAKLGVSDAVLLERNQLTSGTTWHSAAQVRALRSTKNLTDLIRYSISLYSELEAETGQNTGWINKGSLSIATTPDRLIHVKRQEALAKAFGIVAWSVSTEEAQERWPLMNADDVLGAVWSPDDGRVSPSDLCAALVKGAKTRGAKIFEETGVIGIVTEGGRVKAVETTRGTLRCDAIALCTGLWSRQVAAMAGVDVPIWPCEHFYLLTKPVAGITGNMPTLSDHDAHLYVRDDSGGLLVGCFEPMGKAIDPDRLGEDFAFGLLAEDWDHFEPMMINALHRLPILEEAEVKMLLNGPESFTPDGSFLLGESAETRGFHLGCGMNSVGVATGGGAGMALARSIVEGQMPFDLHEADPNRYPGIWNDVRALAARVPEILGTHYEITYPGRSPKTARHLRQSPLQESYTQAGAHYAQVYGWERPAYFGKTEEPTLTFGRPAWFEQVGREVRQAHERAGLFDQSTFGKILVSGPDSASFLNRVCANAMDRAPGRAIYTAMLNTRGGFESDLTAVRLDQERYRLNVGSTAIKRDLSWLRQHLRPGEQVQIEDVTEEFCILGLMGPDASQIATALGGDWLNQIGFFRYQPGEIAGVPVEAVCLSYVGEAGWEMTCRRDQAADLYAALRDAGAGPCGIYAQTAMRIEKRFLSYGHDLDTDVTPLEAGLDFAVDWQSDFIGRAALLRRLEQGVASRMATLILTDTHAVPLGNEPILFNGKIIGTTTSAAFGYRVGAPIALGYLSTASGVFEAQAPTVEIDIAGQSFTAQVRTGAAFDPSGMRLKSKGSS